MPLWLGMPNWKKTGSKVVVVESEFSDDGPPYGCKGKDRKVYIQAFKTSVTVSAVNVSIARRDVLGRSKGNPGSDTPRLGEFL